MERLDEKIKKMEIKRKNRVVRYIYLGVSVN